ncbi:hypothetical protein A2U01_0102697, partial [Trifolium medium]|nr:hypothetical protein [Trifolium medium]
MPASSLACYSPSFAEARDFQIPDEFGHFLSLERRNFGFLVALVAFCRCSEGCSDVWSLVVAG